MVDFKRLDAADNGDFDDPDSEQQSNEFAELYKESLKDKMEYYNSVIKALEQKITILQMMQRGRIH